MGTKTEEGVIILLDALAMKGIWKTKKPEVVLSEWIGVISSTNVDVLACKKDGIDLKFHAFSDTMIITLTGADKLKIIEEAGITISSIISVGIPHGIYFRGCLSFGTIHRYESIPGSFDTNMILGDAIDEAAELYEKSNWVGAFVGPNIEKMLNQEAKGDIWKTYCKYDVPMKEDQTLSTWAVILEDKIRGNLEKNRLTQIIPDKIKEAPCDNAKKKWENTLTFIEYIKKKLSS